MPFNSWNSSLITLQAAGPALTNTTTQTSLLNGQAKFTLPAQFMEFIGQKLRIKAAGTMSTAASTPGTFSFFVVFGAISVYAGGASGTLATSASNATWKLEIDLTMRAVGSATTATAAGSGTFFSTALSATTPVQVLATPGSLTGFDSTSATLVDLQGAWSVASASNTITCQDYELISCI
jgi:hypothetical protein